MYCILGMHSSGTSLVSSILDALNVDMHYNPNARVRWYRNYEDSEFVRLNVQILNACASNWHKPPTIERVLALKESGKFDKRIKLLIKKRSDRWGFKDPRTAITIPLIHPFLDNPHYIRVLRSHSDIAQSMMKRGGKVKKERWIELSKQYNKHIDSFLANNDDVPLLEIMFDDLLNQKKSKQVVQSIAEFVGTKRINKALERIKYSRS